MDKEFEEMLQPYYYNINSDNNELQDNYNKIIEILDSLSNSRNMSKNEFFEKVFIGAFKLIPEAEKGSIYELSGDKYIPVFAKGYDLKTIQKLKFTRDDIFIGFQCSDAINIEAYQTYVIRRDETKFSEDILEIFKKLGTYSDFTSAYAPIYAEGVNIGLICLERFDKTSFSQNSMILLKFYAQIISDFYSQKRIQDKQIKLYDEIIAALVSAIEIKDKYTMGHAKRVESYSIAIAKELQLSESEIRVIATAALLHDIGKIGIPEEILNKPSSLTKEEYEVVKLHPVHSKNILENIDNFNNIAKIAYHHHENYDGTGYPQGLKGDEIPFESQIIQLADAFDAMTSDRAYRKALSSKDALDIIEKEMGKQFNPKIAKVSRKVFNV